MLHCIFSSIPDGYALSLSAEDNCWRPPREVTEDLQVPQTGLRRRRINIALPGITRARIYNLVST